MTTKFKIKKGDKVVVLTGKDKGKTGEVKKVITEDRKVIVDGVNLQTKHRKPTPNSAGGLDKIEAPIHVSNVAIADPKTKKPSRVGYKTVGDRKVRYAKRSGEVID
ncbi:MAG: 50S ribosomal protein L24 [Alphaproteobacteria bacterium]|nr:50S ribosomal protein L24 [Alphaproteobacteria bacterium]